MHDTLEGVTVDMIDLSPCERKLSIEISLDTVTRERDSALSELAKHANIPGFRKGKIPRGVLERRFGEKVQADISTRLIQDAYGDVLRKHELQAVGDPVIEDVNVEAGQPISFSATVEIIPSIELNDLSSITLTRRLPLVTDEEIDEAVDAQRERNARFEPVIDEGVVDGNHLVLDYSAEHDGKPVEGFSGEGREVRVARDDTLEGYYENLLGMNRGETKEFTLTLSDDFPDASLAGNAVDFTVTVHEIKKKVLPEANDDFAKEVSDFDTIAEMRADIKKAIEARNLDIVDNGLRDELLTALIDANPVEPPPNLVRRQIDAIVERSRTNAEAGDGEEPDMEQAGRDAVRSIKEQIMLNAFARGEDIRVSDEDVEKEMVRIAAMLNSPVDLVRDRLGQGDGLARISQQAFVDKVYVRMLETITINDEQIEETDDD